MFCARIRWLPFGNRLFWFYFEEEQEILSDEFK